jgi:4-oxalomesaconate tautomerase
MPPSAEETEGIRCMQMRGGTSKGAFFAASDLPADPSTRDDVLLRIMGSPDPRQIDGIGGAHPLTSKVAVVSPSDSDGADVDYVFLQVTPDSDIVSTSQTCGNILAGVAPFAIERGMVAAQEPTTQVRIRIVNPTESFATATVQTPNGRPTYEGQTVAPGVPFPAAPIPLTFPGSNSSVYPTGSLTDEFAGIEVTCVDAGMPVVLVRACDLDIAGDEAQALLEQDERVVGLVREIRLAAGAAMGLGDVTTTTVPKVSIVSPAHHGGTVTTRTFIPHRVHDAIGVLGAVSVATGVRTPGTVAHSLDADEPGATRLVRIEHPTGTFEVEIDLDEDGPSTRLRHSTVVRTARKLADGLVWPRSGRHHR